MAMADKYSSTAFEAQKKAFKEYLKLNNASATMACVALNIYRPNGCRFKSMLQEAGELVVTHNGRCKETGWRADYLSCDPAIVAKVKGGNSGQ